MGKLKGHRANIGMVLLGMIGIAATVGWIDAVTAGIAASIVGTATGVAMRQGIKASAPK